MIRKTWRVFRSRLSTDAGRDQFVAVVIITAVLTWSCITNDTDPVSSVFMIGIWGVAYLVSLVLEARKIEEPVAEVEDIAKHKDRKVS